jgi:hypothetical protein
LSANEQQINEKTKADQCKGQLVSARHYIFGRQPIKTTMIHSLYVFLNCQKTVAMFSELAIIMVKATEK